MLVALIPLHSVIVKNEARDPGSSLKPKAVSRVDIRTLERFTCAQRLLEPRIISYVNRQSKCAVLSKF
jgi:hypothetical protein